MNSPVGRLSCDASDSADSSLASESENLSFWAISPRPDSPARFLLSFQVLLLRFMLLSSGSTLPCILYFYWISVPSILKCPFWLFIMFVIESCCNPCWCSLINNTYGSKPTTNNITCNILHNHVFLCSLSFLRSSWGHFYPFPIQRK